MKVCKLATDKVVLQLSEPQVPMFSEYEHVLVSSLITTNPRRIDPYWVPATLVVWSLDLP